MAARLKLKLRTLKVTQRSTTGETVRREIPRGCIGIHIQDPSPVETSDDPAGSGFDVETTVYDDSSDPLEPSLHRISQEAAAASWNKIRPAILRAAIENSAMPNHSCAICPAEAECRCLQCSAYFCQECFCDLHSKIGLFHTGEVWEV